MEFESLKTRIQSRPVLFPPAVGEADGENLKLLGLTSFFEIVGGPKSQLGNSRLEGSHLS